MSSQRTLEEKIEVVRLLCENNYNYYATAKETGVTRSTLKAWYNKYRKHIEDSNEVKVIAQQVEMNLGKAKMQFVNKHYQSFSELAEEAVKRAMILIKKEEDLSKVNNTIKTISDFMTKLVHDDEDSKRGNTYNLIQQTIIDCNKER